MELNLPIYPQLGACKNLLIAGMGGGFDVFCGLPIYFELLARGQKTHLANFSFTEVEALRGGEQLAPGLVGVNADQKDFAPYFPERHLSKWFKTQRNEAVTVWTLQKSGVRPLKERLNRLVSHLDIDGILLIDGGVDSLMQGDETGMGTVIEDATMLCAVSALSSVPTRILVTSAMGSERDVNHTQVFENIATLTKAGGFLGACALTPQMPSYELFEAAVRFAHETPYQDPSVVNASIISATRGEFGDFHLTRKTDGSTLAISPLMTLYWCFDLPTVAAHNRLLPYIEETDTFIDGMRQLHAFMAQNRRRQTKPLAW